ncbi:hypothetical protein [Adhaeribacter aquaticus]|uniref:hypothetical protein n=1 Tax=Adhaeribacter aquaticus TaxID=299567 RepID=UPI0003FC2DDA|nr:hypothetical protein [Adhaeribacter aquaticus]
MAAASNRHKLNGKDLFDVFGIAVEDGLGEFDTPFPIKEVLSHSWPEESGRDFDLSEGLNFDSKQIRLKCFIVANSKTEFYTKKQAFEAEICKPGWQTWHNVDHSKDYSVKYEGASNGNKASRRYENVSVIVFTFDLNLTVQPTLMPQFDNRVAVLLNGVFYAYGYPGSTVNVATVNGGATPTISISDVTAVDRKITITASGTPGYDLQYSINSGATYQSSPVFENVADGTYTNKIMARLVGTAFTATSDQAITITYVPPTLPESVEITNVTPYNNSITVLATPYNTNKAIEYSRDGITYQTSNVFSNVPNGDYQISVRLMGTSVTDTWDSLVKVEYTPPANSYNTILFPGQSVGGVSFALDSEASTAFHFNAPVPSNPPFPASMPIFWQNNLMIGLVDFNAGAIGQPCAFTYNGTMYHVPGGLQNQEVSIG